MIRNPMIRNTKRKTRQKWIVAPKIKMALHADREIANVKEAKVWKRGVRIDQKIVQRTRSGPRTILRTIIRRILGTIVKIGIRIGKEIGIMKDVINMNAKNANVAAPQSVVTRDRQNQNVMTTIIRARNEKYQVNEAKANNDLCVRMPEK